MIYLDNNSTTLLAPEVYAHIQPLMQELVGNPSSIHRYGQHARGHLTDAIKRCSQYFGVHPDELIFTSGATEALNLLIHNIPRQGHVITSSIEHAAVYEPLKLSGREVTYLDPIQGKGAVTPSQVKEAMQENTRLIILSAANNETGICIDFEEIARIADEAHVPFAIDGVALLGKSSFSLPKGVTAACFSGHKIHGPLGIGVAIMRKPLKTRPFILGGPQQRGLRAGTENLVAILGFVKALELLEEKWIKQMCALRQTFEERLLDNLPNAVIHGKEEVRVCNTSNIAFPGVDGETLLMMLDLAGVACSHGSACSSGTLSTSRTLLNMGIDPPIARASLRFSLSRYTTAAEIESSVGIITDTVKQLKGM